MGNGLSYRIPRFQQDYSWTEDPWEELWMDILGTINPGGEPAHYMGYLVLQSDNDKVFDVIDGQQRLTPLNLIVLTVLKNLQRLVDANKDPDRNRQRLDQIRQTYVGYLDPVTLVSHSKLTLNRNNDTYFQSYIVPLGHLPTRGFRASEHGLRKAFEWFDKHVADYVAKGTGDVGMALAQFVEAMSDKLFFTVITERLQGLRDAQCPRRPTVGHRFAQELPLLRPPQGWPDQKRNEDGSRARDESARGALGGHGGPARERELSGISSAFTGTVGLPFSVRRSYSRLSAEGSRPATRSSS
jgi:hypothetical protein